MTYVDSNVGDGQRGTHLGALCQRNVDYCWPMFLQLDDFIISSISCAEEKVLSPCKKIGLGWRVICIVIVASEWRGDAVRKCSLM
jgi:hypothetical protein